MGRMKRRDFLVQGAAVVGGGALIAAASKYFGDGPQASVFIGSAANYQSSLRDCITRGLDELKFGKAQIAGKRVVLKPNLVEPNINAPHINTHPLFIQAVTETFRGLGASDVIVAEGQGHVRDSLWVLEQSGVGDVLQHDKIEFTDLNHDEIVTIPNMLRMTSMQQLHLPRTITSADIVVSLPKMKTHHWAGATLSLKNLFGIMPGIVYGWPKNVLHQHGINQSIMDIYANFTPHLAIVDGITAMEGDGPIMGTPKEMGTIVMGQNLIAVDATCARLMQIDPYKLIYLNKLPRTYGPIAEAKITQLGETIASRSKLFQLLPDLEPDYRMKPAA